MDFLTMSISSSGSWTSVERIMSGTRHPIRFVIEAIFFWRVGKPTLFSCSAVRRLYPVSQTFLQAVKANTRKYYWTGTITTTTGTVYNFDQDDIVKGSGYIRITISRHIVMFCTMSRR